MTSLRVSEVETGRTRARPARLLAIAATPGYYHAPLFRAVALDPRVDLTVAYESRQGLELHDPGFGTPIVWDVDQLAGYRYVFLDDPDRGRSASRRGGSETRAAARFLGSGSYDALWVHGFSSPSIWRAVRAARRRRMAVLIREEQTLLHRRPLHRRLPRALALRTLFRGAHGLYISSNNRDFFSAYGIPPDRLWSVPYSVDNARLRDAGRELIPRRAELRARFGVLDDRPVVLFVGKLIPKKQPERLLAAFVALRSRIPSALVFVGDGELRRQLEDQARGVPDVHFAGFMNQAEVPAAYVAADVFVLPSAFHETFGLVVAEAMNFGLPVIASDRVGCARDLVSPGENGLVFSHENTAALEDALRAILADPEMRGRMGMRSLEMVQPWTYDVAARGVVEATLAAAATGDEAQT